MTHAEDSKDPLVGALILVVEDEDHLAQGIAENLEAEGATVTVVGDGKGALAQLLERSWDSVILDVMLPELDGFEVCRQARERGIETPILFLTAKGGVHDRIHGLEVGGDDYLAKPFHLKELLLRVRAILRRRTPGEVETTLSFGDNEVDFRSYTAKAWDGTSHELTQKEVQILKLLSEREGEVVSRDEILERVWGPGASPSTRTVDNFLVKLRKRFEPDENEVRHFHTVWGVGYRFTGDSSRE